MSDTLKISLLMDAVARVRARATIRAGSLTVDDLCHVLRSLLDPELKDHQFALPDETREAARAAFAQGKLDALMQQFLLAVVASRRQASRVRASTPAPITPEAVAAEAHSPLKAVKAALADAVQQDLLAIAKDGTISLTPTGQSFLGGFSHADSKVRLQKALRLLEAAQAEAE